MVVTDLSLPMGEGFAWRLRSVDKSLFAVRGVRAAESRASDLRLPREVGFANRLSAVIRVAVRVVAFRGGVVATKVPGAFYEKMSSRLKLM